MVVVMLAAIGYVSQKRSFLPSWTPAVIIQDETVLYGKNRTNQRTVRYLNMKKL